MTTSSLVLIGPSQLMIDHAEQVTDRLLLIDYAENLAVFEFDNTKTQILRLNYLECSAEDLAHKIQEFQREDERFCGVIALTDKALLLQAQLNHILDIPDNSPEAISTMVDKAAMREFLNTHTDLHTRFGIAANPNEAREIVKTFESSYPCIGKPQVGRASLGVHVVRTSGEFETLEYPLLVEEYLYGQEYSVEGICDNGAYHIFGITVKEKGVPGHVDELAEFGHLHPAPLSPNTTMQVTRAISTFMKALGVRTGIHHTEVFITPKGAVRVVETHARNGGQHIVDLVRIATGVDMVECAIHQRLGILTRDRLSAPALTYAGVRYFHTPSGVVSRIQGLPRTRFSRGICAVELYKTAGEHFTAGVGSGEQIGCVIAQADSFEELDARLTTALESVSIIIDEV